MLAVDDLPRWNFTMRRRASAPISRGFIYASLSPKSATQLEYDSNTRTVTRYWKAANCPQSNKAKNLGVLGYWHAQPRQDPVRLPAGHSREGRQTSGSR